MLFLFITIKAIAIIINRGADIYKNAPVVNNEITKKIVINIEKRISKPFFEMSIKAKIIRRNVKKQCSRRSSSNKGSKKTTTIDNSKNS